MEKSEDMEKFYLERPSMERYNDAVLFINEFIDNNSEIHGVGSLDKYINDYEKWLKMVDENWNREVSDVLVPSHTYFFVRHDDNKIVGMIDIRLALTERLRSYGGNIGYSIRPSERGKGYNKLNLYLALKVCDSYGLEKVMLDCDKNNYASAHTIMALGGVLTKEEYNEYADRIVQDYWIDVKDAIIKHSKYEDYMYTEV